MTTWPAREGGTIEITRTGPLLDIRVRDGSGRTIATVTRRAGERLPKPVPHPR
ncbi:hypothetical protein GCM10010329_84950 [Streptomyces spiroverticillatus]|uniref:Uncharacterized protein n=1 Tax=Streptomyces finlayi TaxID=67296 RepID=A0A918XAD6_9ACTN|nr:hypothetical protein GCM10010329_84950 [Streptomyces spiroverticillatus]GHD19625.1 hypothetical protein GCM10010334_83480 [Streptomyces finlayi]